MPRIAPLPRTDLSLFGYLNRCNDTVATELEEIPNDFATGVLGPQGWDSGKHRT